MLDQWGSLRYATTTAFLACVYSDWRTVIRKKQKLIWSLQEARRLCFGSTGRSFVVGFGENPPKRPITELLTVHGRTVRWSLPNTGMFFMVPLWEDLTARTTTPTTSVITPAMKLPVTIMQVLWDCLQNVQALWRKSRSQFNGIEEVPEDEIFVEAGVNASETISLK